MWRLTEGGGARSSGRQRGGGRRGHRGPSLISYGQTEEWWGESRRPGREALGTKGRERGEEGGEKAVAHTRCSYSRTLQGPKVSTTVLLIQGGTRVLAGSALSFQLNTIPHSSRERCSHHPIPSMFLSTSCLSLAIGGSMRLSDWSTRIESLWLSRHAPWVAWGLLGGGLCFQS